MNDNIKVFLLSMEIGGIKNLEKPVHISFYNETITNDFDPSKYRIKGIYGENGVGKSAIMTGVLFYKYLLTNSKYLGGLANDKAIKYLINKKTNKASFEFEFLIQCGKTIMIYKHSIELSKNKTDDLEIVSEKAYKRRPNTKYEMIYSVNNGILNFVNNDEYYNIFVEKTKNLLTNCTVISKFPDMKDVNNYQGHYIDLYNIYNCGLLIYVYLNQEDSHNEYIFREVAQKYGIDVVNCSQNVYLDYIYSSKPVNVKKEDMKAYEELIKELEKFIKIYKPNLKSIDVDKKPNRDVYVCSLNFVYDEFTISSEFESTGIKKLVELFMAFKYVSCNYINYMVFIDELDSNIHDYYLCRLLEYVAEYTEGQLCFTSHNLGPMEVLKEYKKSIDFLSRDGEIVPWIKNGNYNVANQYKEGKIRKFPFNIDSFDFIKVFGNEEE